MFRQAAARNLRLFSTSVRLGKSPVEQAQEALKSVDRAVSDQAVKGIEKGQEAAQKAREAAGVGAEKAAEGAKETKLEAEKKVNDVKKEAEKKM